MLNSIWLIGGSVKDRRSKDAFRVRRPAERGEILRLQA